MSAGRYPLLLEQGTTIDFEFQYQDSNGTPVDLSGYGARMQIRPSVASTTVYLTLSSSLQPDGTGLNMSGSTPYKPPTSGTIGVYISSCTSSLFAFDEGVYDLEIYAPSATGCPTVSRLLQGPVKISKEVTR